MISVNTLKITIFYDNGMIILFIQIFSTLLMNIIQIHIEIESFVQKTSEDHKNYLKQSVFYDYFSSIQFYLFLDNPTSDEILRNYAILSSWNNNEMKVINTIY